MDQTRPKLSSATPFPDEDRYRRLIDAITDYAIFMLDADGCVSSWNPGAQRFKGYAAEEILGQHFSRFYTPEDRAAGVPARALRTAAQEGRFEGEGWRLRKDGSRFWAHVIIDPIREPSGALAGFAKITRDLTEQHEAERERDEAREALLQSQKLDALGQLTGGVAHDFNNLLMTIIGGLDLVRKRLPPDPKVTPLLENAMQAAQRGSALTQRMLAFARRQPLDLRPVEAPTLVRGVVEMLKRSLGPGVRVSTRFAADLRPALTDPHQLENALVNLALNARDAMPGGGTIRIEGERRTVMRGHEGGLAPGAYLRLSVRDSGHGMDACTLARATEPFFTTKGVGAGAGLGLSMAHGLAEQSGGRLMISSCEGEGTVVELWLPEAYEAAQNPGAPLAGQAAHPGGTAPLVILAVDDDALVLLNTAAMLEDLGHRVLTAADAEEALAILAAEKIDLVITDFAMPGVDGLRLARTVQERWPGVTVLLATGYAELPESQGGDGPLRLSKPYLQSDLARAILAARENRAVA
ncbi:MAG TPA: PAS domain S-box protein [Caulobacteraceae bacterium]|jgi:PAS domain S-box-containing protein